MEVIGILTPPQEWSRRLGYVVQIVLLILVLLALALVCFVSLRSRQYLTKQRSESKSSAVY
jgi:hypothetical protein